MAPAHPGEGHRTEGECARGACSILVATIRRRITSVIERIVHLYPKPSIGSHRGHRHERRGLDVAASICSERPETGK